MEPMHERITKVVADSGLTKTAFSERLKVTQQYVSNLCLGKKVPSDRTVSDICREFRVNEVWLRTGEGEPYLIEEENLAALLGSMLHEEMGFKQRLISVLLRMSPEEWEMLEHVAWDLVDELERNKKEAGPEGPAQD